MLLSSRVSFSHRVLLRSPCPGVMGDSRSLVGDGTLCTGGHSSVHTTESMVVGIFTLVLVLYPQTGGRSGTLVGTRSFCIAVHPTERDTLSAIVARGTAAWPV